MDAQVERRAIALYEDLLSLSRTACEARLREIDGTDPVLTATVRAMIDADRNMAMLPTIASFKLPADAAGGEETMPVRIGRFRLVEELGRGGMGVVYRGERDDGLFDQRVAIKLIRRTVFSERALAQFATERRILARLHHPHIAQMLDGGVTEDGLSYIVMELIDGIPITDHAEQRGLDLAARLALFVDAAETVEHAHRNLVVHADIKPSNVIVAEGFGVKLLDFGIARLLGGSDDDARHGGYTPSYGSPARRESLPPTPADDICALGILMHALIAPTADADLRAVADKASAQDPDRRYGTAGEMIDDIRRWRENRGVAAHPPGHARRLLLYWRRHRLALTLVAVAALALLVTSVATTLLWLRADAARDAAEQRFQETRALSRYLVEDVTRALAPLPASGPIRERIAERAEGALDRLSRLPEASSDVQAESALASSQVGAILAGLDQRASPDPVAAERALDRAEASLGRLIAGAAGAAPATDAVRVALARTLISRASFLTLTRNEAGAALRVLDRADALLAEVAARRPGLAMVEETRWDAALKRATVLDREGEYRANLAILGAALRHAPGDPAPRRAEQALRLEQNWTLLGDAQWYLGDPRAALRSYRLARAALSHPSLAADARIVVRIAFAQYDVASTLASLGRDAAALAEIERGMTAAQRLRSFDDTPQARHVANIVQSEYAVELAGVGRFDEAIAQARASVAGGEALARLEPASYDALRAVPVDLRPMAEIYRAAGRVAEACATAARANALWDDLAGQRPLSKFDGASERVILMKMLKACPAR